MAVKVWDVNTDQEIFQLIHSHDQPLVMGINLSPDGRWLAIQNRNNTLQVVAVDTGQEVIQTISQDWDFSSDSQHLALINDDNAVSIWDMSTMQVQTRLTHDQKVSVVIFSPGGRWIATRTEDKVWLWDVTTGQLIHKFTQEDAWLSFSPDDRLLAIIDRNDQVVRLWDIATGQEITQVAHGVSISGLDFSPDGGWLATLNQDGIVQVWDTSRSVEIAQIILKPNISTLAFSPDGRWLTTSVQDGTTQLWEAGSWRESARIAQGAASVIFSADGKRLALNRYAYGVQVWEIEPGPEVVKFSSDSKGKFERVAFSPNGQWVAAIQKDKENNNIRIWNIATGDEVVQLEDSYGWLALLVFSPDSHQIAAGDSNGAMVWDVATGQEVSRMTHEGAVNVLAFSPDGQRIISGGGGGQAKIWEVTTGNEIASVNNLAEVRDVTFSPDGRWAAIGTTRDTVLWAVTARQEAARLAYDESIIGGKKVAFSPDSRLLAAGDQLRADKGRNIVRIWDVTTQQEIRQLVHTYIISEITFSPDGQLLAAGTNQIYFDWALVGEIRIWDAATGREIAFIDSGPVAHLSFSPDSRWLVRGDKIWEASTGREVARMSYRGAVYQAALSPDGRWLATAGEDHVSIWAWQPADLTSQACKRLTRNLTRQEWRQYLGDEPYRPTCPNLPVPEE